MSRQKVARELRKHLDAMGLQIVDEKMGGCGHLKFRVRKGEVVKTIIGPTNLGDVRAERNWLTQVKKAFAAA